MRCALAIIALVLAPVASAALPYSDLISYSPPAPTAADEVVFRVDGWSGGSPSFAFAKRIEIQGSVIRLLACINQNAFAVPSSYVTYFNVAPLRSGAYSVEYHRAYCSLTGTPVHPYQLTATLALDVLAGNHADAIPALSSIALAGLGAILALAAMLRLRSRKQLTLRAVQKRN